MIWVACVDGNWSCCIRAPAVVRTWKLTIERSEIESCAKNSAKSQRSEDSRKFFCAEPDFKSISRKPGGNAYLWQRRNVWMPTDSNSSKKRVMKFMSVSIFVVVLVVVAISAYNEKQKRSKPAPVFQTIKSKICTRCHGSGGVSMRCPTCSGFGGSGPDWSYDRWEDRLTDHGSWLPPTEWGKKPD